MRKDKNTFEIQFFVEELDFLLENPEFYEQWIFKVLIEEKIKECKMNYIFCSDDYLLKINQEYLNHDTYTDIITFPLNQTEDSIEGDIYISIDRVKDNAKQYAKSFVEELSRVIVHGVLHLVGYDDKTDKEKKAMRAKEDYYLSLLSF